MVSDTATPYPNAKDKEFFLDVNSEHISSTEKGKAAFWHVQAALANIAKTNSVSLMR